MCGILGEFSFGRSLLDKVQFDKILFQSKNRGPDYTGYYSNNENLQFGFNRLKILDLTENGNQPIFSQDKRFLMVFNGEIYNYLEIKKKLSEYNIKFKGNGDAEVIVNAFSIYGLQKTINMLDGMFAIGLYDNKKKELSLIRDFAGIKPLHYGYNKNILIFASQYNQVASHPIFKKESIDKQVLKLYLNQHFISAPFGILKKTHQLEPGDIISFDKNGRISKNKYWTLPKYQKATINDKRYAEDILMDSLNKSIKSELVSDVSVGSFLSSGVDSPLISSIANEFYKQTLTSVTIGSESQKHDETELANIYSREIGLNHISKIMNSSDAINILDDLIGSITEPFADISIIPTFLISKLSKEYFNVALSGDGGDELFFGYERFGSIAKNNKIQNLPFLLKYLIYGTDKILSKNRNFNSNCLFSLSSEAHFHLQSRFEPNLIIKLFKDLQNTNYPRDFRNFDYENTNNNEKLYQYMRYSEFYGMMQKTLKKIDLASMHHSLEVRVPFLKKEFINNSLLISPYLNFSFGEKNIFKGKKLLKSLLRKKLPKIPINKTKKGFSIPLTNWLQNDLMKHFSAVLMDKSMAHDFGIDQKEIELMLNSHKNKKNDYKWPIFTLFSLFSWRKNLLK